MKFTIRHFLISWGVFNLIPLFFPNSQVEKIWFGGSTMSFTKYWDRVFDFDKYSSMYFWNGMSGYVNTIFFILFVMCLIGIYKTIKRGTII